MEAAHLQYNQRRKGCRGGPNFSMEHSFSTAPYNHPDTVYLVLFDSSKYTQLRYSFSILKFINSSLQSAGKV